MLYRPLKVEDIEKRIVPILKKYNIPKAVVFGSSARNEMRRGSDVDLEYSNNKDEILLS